MTISAALLDAEGNFLRMDSLTSEKDLTDRHLPQITSCDLPAGVYRWVPSEDRATFPQGGSFLPVRFIEVQAQNAQAMLHAIARKREGLDEMEQRIRNGSKA